MVDNLSIDIFHYLITVHTGIGKDAGTTSNISFVISGELGDTGVRKLNDGKIKVCSLEFPLKNIHLIKLKEFRSGSVRNFVLSTESPLGSLLCLRIWHDNSGEKNKASWYLSMINVMDLQTGEK